MGTVMSKLNCCDCFRGGGRGHLTQRPLEEEEEDGSRTPPIFETLPTFSWDSRPKPQNFKIEHEVDQEVIRVPGSINGEQLLIENCVNSHIYLLDHSAALTIDDCEGCLIVTGPVRGSIFVRDTKNTTLCSVSSQLRLRDCHSILLFSSAESEPIIENCTEIQVSRYPIAYDLIDAHLALASISPKKLVSNSVYDFTPPPGWDEVGGQARNWSVLENPEVRKFVRPPFRMDLEGNPGVELFRISGNVFSHDHEEGNGNKC